MCIIACDVLFTCEGSVPPISDSSEGSEARAGRGWENWILMVLTQGRVVHPLFLSLHTGELYPVSDWICLGTQMI